MIVKYDKLNRLEKPILTLCNPGSVYDANTGALTKVVGILTDHEAEEVVFNFNATSELNFRVNRVRRENEDDNAHTYKLYRAIQNRRLIFLNDIGYFMITDVKDGFDGAIHYKDVTAQSIDVEIQQKVIPYIDGTYRFCTDETDTDSKGIIETIVETLPLWTIGNVDAAVAEKQRTFEDVDTTSNCLSFLLENVQDAYECIVLFDIVNRTINVYDQNNYVRRTDIHLTKDDLINSLEITENSDDLYTAIRVSGNNDNVTIAAINPTGSNVIYNFDHYRSWMSHELSEKVLAWQNAVIAAMSGYYATSLAYYQQLSEVARLEAEIGRLETQLTMYQRCRDNIIAGTETKQVDEYLVVDGGFAEPAHRASGDPGKEFGTLGVVDDDDRVEQVLVQEALNQGQTTPSSGHFAYVLSDVLSDETPKYHLVFCDDIHNGTRVFVSYKYIYSVDQIDSLVNSYNDVISPPNDETHREDRINISNEIADVVDEIDILVKRCRDDLAGKDSDLQSAEQAASTLLEQIQSVHNTLAIENCFTQQEYDELYNYIFEGSYTDEYVVITDSMSYEEKFNQMKILYDRADAQLKKVSSPTQEFSIDVENFIFVKEFEHWSNQLETGCLINVELEQDDIAELFLSNITVNYDDHKLSMTFGNRFNKFDPKSLFEDVLGNISKSANTINYIKDILYPIKSGEFNNMKEAVQTSRDITMAGALASDNEEVVIDGSGYTGRRKLGNGSYDSRQIKITGRTIAFTDNAWEDCKVAIGEILFGQDGESAYGVNAKAIIGDIIMGNNLRIIDNDGNDLMEVVDGRITMQVRGVDDRVTTLEQDANNLTIRVGDLEARDSNVDHVTTTTGYTFGADGLNIHKTGEEMINLINNTGMYVRRSDENVLTANNNGVEAINLLARQYLIIGSNSRFENYSDGTDTKRTACFYIGG